MANASDPETLWFHLQWFEDAAILLIGAILGYWFGRIAERHEEKKRWRELRRDAAVEGNYIAYDFPGNSSVPNFPVPSANDVVTYDKKNIFNLVHNETGDRNVWEGKMFFDTPTTGLIVWQYTKLNGLKPPREVKYGFKRFVITDFERDGQRHRYICLVGEEGYKREILEKVE